DVTAAASSGLFETSGATFFGDKGYVGCGIITPVKRRPGQIALTPAQKTINRSVNQIRYVVERSIARLKNWKILKYPFRGPLQKHSEIIRAVVSLENYRTSL
ncbi:MAG: transposase family protein, partial [Propionibacteriaceae bacterium]|nr:transposase family protein [Propionibacteriaceae bacterium]